ncbi:hypothetical protein LTS17_012809 [Exophiala oligosperma]
MDRLLMIAYWDRHRARALLLLPLFANASNFISPLIGGFLRPEEADLSEDSYPFRIPNFLVASLHFSVALAVCGLLDEPRLHAYPSRRRSSRGDIRRSGYGAISTDTPTRPPVSRPEALSRVSTYSKQRRKLAFRRMWTSNVVCTLLSQFIVSGHVGTFPILWAVFLSMPHPEVAERTNVFRFNGGLDMHPRKDGSAMSLTGALGILVQLSVYPMLQDRFSTIKIWRSALMIFPLVYWIAPYHPLMASPIENDDRAMSAAVWLLVGVVIFVLMVARSGVTPATTLPINDCTLHPPGRATIHAPATVVANLSRSTFPVISMAVFGRGSAIGVKGLAFWFSQDWRLPPT